MIQESLNNTESVKNKAGIGEMLGAVKVVELVTIGTL